MCISLFHLNIVLRRGTVNIVRATQLSVTWSYAHMLNEPTFQGFLPRLNTGKQHLTSFTFA